ncbi:MAG TPA: MFS transporter [Steroidobacteraceae bacterium]|nr:MFS transporter [Steroidobacteraceae bacterium]
MKQGGWASLILIYLYGVVSAASLTKAIPLQAHITQLPGAGPALFGLFVSLMAILPAIFGTLSGAVIDRLGARPALILAALIGGLVNGLYTVAGSILPFEVLRVIEGAVPLLVYAAAPALMIATSAPERRSAAMALWSSYTPVGTSLGLLISAAFASGGQWRDAYVAHGAIFVLLVIAGLALPKTAGVRPAAAPRRSVLALLRSRQGLAPLRLASSFGILILLGLGVSVVMPTYLAHHYAIGIATASSIMAATNVVMILGSTLSGIILTRGVLPATLFIVLALVGSIAGFGVFAPWTHMAFTIASLLIWLICTGAAMAVLASLLPRVAGPEHRASTAGLLSQTGALTTFVTSPLWLAVLALNQWLALFMIILTGWGLSAVLLPAESRSTPQPHPAPR